MQHSVTIPTLGWIGHWEDYPAQTQAAYAAFDMLMPWTGGAFESTYESTEWWMTQNLAALSKFVEKYPRSWANNQPINFMIHMGTAAVWTNMGTSVGEPNGYPRYAGQPLWDQLNLLMENYPPQSLFIYVFDEFDEATNIMKAARDYFDIPTDQYFLTHAADGWWLSEDYYLRATGALIEMFKGSRPLTPVIEIPHSLGPLYYRNSFELRDSRSTFYDQNGVRYYEPRPNQRIDPGLNNPALLANKGSGVTLTTNAIIKTPGKSGEYAFHLAGNGNGSAYYKIADVKIGSTDRLELKYSLQPRDAAGRDVFVDVLFEDGSLLSEHSEEVINTRGNINAWTDVTIIMPQAVTGKRIAGVVVGYSGSGGSFSAYVDDIIIQKYALPQAPNINQAASWARDEINSAFRKGIITTELLSDYERDITRGEFVRLAMNFLRVKTGMTNEQLIAAHATHPDRTFTDTTDPNIIAAGKLGITSGTGGTEPNRVFGDGLFDREMAAFMLVQVHRILGYDITDFVDQKYNDMHEVRWHPNAINFVITHDVMRGTNPANKIFSPRSNFTRQQSILTFDRIG
jgi:hypothetical protein